VLWFEGAFRLYLCISLEKTLIVGWGLEFDVIGYLVCCLVFNLACFLASV